jgi:hypothetical protein
MYLRTWHGTYLAIVEGAVLGHVELTEKNLPLLVSTQTAVDQINDGALSGLFLRPVDGGVSLYNGEFYYCAAPDRPEMTADREQAAGWETFNFVTENELLRSLKPDPTETGTGDLAECDLMWGQSKIISADPSVSVKDSCLYIPYSSNSSWGIFNSDGSPELDAFGNFAIYRQILRTDLNADSISDVSLKENYIYIGYVNCHFGHFLIDTLPRLWLLRAMHGPKYKLLCHSDLMSSQWFAYPHIAEILGRLGLNPSDFELLDRPTKLRNVVIPRTSLLPQLSAHKCYAEFARELFKDLIGAQINSDDRPIYYSKTKLTFGVGRIANEHEIEEHLSSRGVEIVYPETLPLIDQIKLMSERRYILGTAGSFLHASVFCPPRKIRAISMKRTINANFRLIDGICGADSKYFYSPNARDVALGTKNFGNATYIPDARTVAEKLYSSIFSE